MPRGNDERVVDAGGFMQRCARIAGAALGDGAFSPPSAEETTHWRNVALGIDDEVEADP